MPPIHVHYLPQFVDETDLANSAVIVVDLLRASTTICFALESGAECVGAFVELNQAVDAANRYGRDQVLLAGERGGLRIEGFDLGNSPPEFTPEGVAGRRVLFSTTNGTRALEHARLAGRVLVGAAVNRAAVVEAVRDAPRVDVLCAGTGGNVTREDLLAAGAIVHAWRQSSDDDSQSASGSQWRGNEWTEAVDREWQELLTAARASGRSASEQFANELRRVPHGKTLIELGFESDLDVCAQLDVMDVVPEYNPATGEIRLA